MMNVRKDHVHLKKEKKKKKTKFCMAVLVDVTPVRLLDSNSATHVLQVRIWTRHGTIIW